MNIYYYKKFSTNIDLMNKFFELGFEYDEKNNVLKLKSGKFGDYLYDKIIFKDENGYDLTGCIEMKIWNDKIYDDLELIYRMFTDYHTRPFTKISQIKLVDEYNFDFLPNIDFLCNFENEIIIARFSNCLEYFFQIRFNLDKEKEFTKICDYMSDYKNISMTFRSFKRLTDYLEYVYGKD